MVIGFRASAEHYERWRAGPVPAELRQQLEGLLTTGPVNRVYRIVEAVS